MRIILASASPQRRELLKGLGLLFDVLPSSIEESACTEKDPVLRAAALSRMKALDVHASHPDACVIGCDTLVVSANGTLLEKPVDAADAERMLRLQSGKVSIVHSALCVLSPASVAEVREPPLLCEGISSSFVHFKKLSEQEIAWWIATNQWKDRSGAFQIDGRGQLMIEKIEGDWTGIVGLPVFLLGELMKKAGVRMDVVSL